jgi:hypothetical protein
MRKSTFTETQIVGILKDAESGGPISRPPCSGIVTDRPSLCVQRSWLPVWRRLTKPSASAAR